MMETLTSQQQAAVQNRGGSLLVSAAAGSGKTKVLVERLFRYVTEDHRDLDAFLMITYTRAAAAELRGKIAAELSRRVAQAPEDRHLRAQLLRVYQADIKTVDAFCTALLRENTHLLPSAENRRSLTPDFRVLDEGEAVLLRQRVLRRTLEDFYENLTPGKELLADTMGAGRDDSRLEALVLEVYEKLQSHADPAAWLEKSRTAWSDPAPSFDRTPYARELLAFVRRRAAYWKEQFLRGAARTEGDPSLKKGYGDRFLTAAAGLEALENCQTWEDARALTGAVAFPRLATPRGRKDEPLIRSLKRIWDACKDGVKELSGLLDTSGEDAAEDLRRIAPAMEALLDLVGDFSDRYRQEKLRTNRADFSDMEHLALGILVQEDGGPTPLGRQIASRYEEILVDEYQDTNEVQNAIFQAVSRQGKNLFTVGDVKQSIYRFRLADPSIFLEKYARFRPWQEAQEGQERKILLSKNFRSRQEVLDGANFVFSNILSPEMGEMAYGPEEALYFGAEYYPPRQDCAVEFHLISARRRTEGGDPPVTRLEAEARFTAGRIRELLDSGFPVTDGGALRPCRPEDIVILMRSPHARLPAYYAALTEQNVPCSFEEGGGFFRTMEVSTVLAFLRIVDNPRQDVPLISVLRSPLFSFSPDRLAEIRAALPSGDYYEAVKACAERGDVDCAAFLDALNELRALSSDMGVSAFLWHLYNTRNVLGIFAACDGGAERRENLLALTAQAERFESGGYKGIFAFLTYLGRLMDAGKAPEGRAGDGGGVRLMSIHRSKGLEFPIVILADLDRAFSRQDFRAPVLVHPDLGLGPQFVDLERRIRYPTLARAAVQARLTRENLAEEQRILYVAMTRPKEKLILVDSLYGGESRIQKLASRTALPVPPEAVAEAGTFGDWLLLCLLSRPEAACLRSFGDAEIETLYNGPDSPWQVFVHDAEDFGTPEAAVPTAAEVPESAPASFDATLLEYAYPYRRETALPAKVTATQLKGRVLDEEIAEHAARTPWIRPLSQPKFRWNRGLTPAERGTATHLLLQYLDFSGEDPARQAAALTERNLLTAEQASAVDLEGVRTFLASPLAEEIRRSPQVLREYPFTLLIPSGEPSGDTMLLQGVVDCCFETEDGFVVVDFKTDHVRSGPEARKRAERYRPQVQAYSNALERVLERPVIRRVLYFLGPGEAVEME